MAVAGAAGRKNSGQGRKADVGGDDDETRWQHLDLAAREIDSLREYSTVRDSCKKRLADCKLRPIE